MFFPLFLAWHLKNNSNDLKKKKKKPYQAYQFIEYSW